MILSPLFFPPPVINTLIAILPAKNPSPKIKNCAIGPIFGIYLIVSTNYLLKNYKTLYFCKKFIKESRINLCL